MSSEVEICNLALSHIGTKSTIASLTENSNEARQCNLLYVPARDHTLRAHPWKFAQKRVALADLGSPPQGWLYRYQYPSDCIAAREILPDNKDTDDPVPFEVAVSDDLKSKVILCDKAGAYLRYTARVTDPTLFDPMFVTALSWWLAFLLAKPLTGSETERKAAYEGWARAMTAAWAADSSEREKGMERDAEHIRARA